MLIIENIDMVVYKKHIMHITQLASQKCFKVTTILQINFKEHTISMHVFDIIKTKNSLIS